MIHSTHFVQHPLQSRNQQALQRSMMHNMAANMRTELAGEVVPVAGVVSAEWSAGPGGVCRSSSTDLKMPKLGWSESGLGSCELNIVSSSCEDEHSTKMAPMYDDHEIGLMQDIEKTMVF